MEDKKDDTDAALEGSGKEEGPVEQVVKKTGSAINSNFFKRIPTPKDNFKTRANSRNCRKPEHLFKFTAGGN
jgi:hypothetical protein